MRNGLEIDKYGDKRWYLNYKLHRVDGPAVVYEEGDKYWYINGLRHREDGPAIEYSNGDKFWYLNNEQLSEKDYLQRTRKNKLTELLDI